MHIFYLNDYASKFTPRRYNMVIFSYAAVTTFQSVIGIVSNGDLTYKGYIALPLNAFLIIGTIAMYAYSIKKLKEHFRNKQYLPRSSRSIVKIGTLYLFIFMLTFSPGLVVQSFFEIIRDNLGGGVIGMLLAVAIMIANLGSFFNAVIFLSVNVQAKQFLKKHFRRRRRIVHPNIIQVI